MYLIEDEEEIPKKSGNSSASNTSPAVPKPTEEFKQAFMVVVRYFGCSEEEIALLKTIAMGDYENASASYLRMEAMIVGAAKGINERIRADIKRMKEGNGKHRA